MLVQLPVKRIKYKPGSHYLPLGIILPGHLFVHVMCCNKWSQDQLFAKTTLLFCARASVRALLKQNKGLRFSEQYLYEIFSKLTNHL